MQLNIPLGARQNHTALKVENNQSRRRRTSLSVPKLPVSGLYLKLFVRGSTFLLSPPGIACPIAGKPREKVELLSLKFLPLFSFSSPPSSIPPVGPRWLSLESTFFHMSIPHWLLGLPLSPYPSTLDFSPIICCHMPLMDPVDPQFFPSALAFILWVSHSPIVLI